MIEGIKFLIGYPVLFSLLVIAVAIVIPLFIMMAITLLTLIAGVVATPFLLWKDRKRSCSNTTNC